MPSSAAVEAVLGGPDGVFAHVGCGSLAMDMSTIDPAVTDRLAKAARANGLAFVDDACRRHRARLHHRSRGQGHCLVTKVANAARVPMPMAAKARETFTMARVRGFGGCGFSAVLDALCEIAGIEKPRPAKGLA